ncbi:alpha/beta hydrolase, partial [Nonomuraea sp. FMUSA5-5]
VAGLQDLAVEVLAPDRPHQPSSWADEAQHLTAALPGQPVTVIAGSNGCSAAVRLTLASPERIERLLLAWPATASDLDIDIRTRRGLSDLGASPQVIDTLLAGQTLRGTTDDDLAAITQPVGVLPCVPENRYHQRRTVDALLRAMPHALELPGCPEPPHPGFPPHAEFFIRTAAKFALM